MYDKENVAAMARLGQIALLQGDTERGKKFAAQANDAASENDERAQGLLLDRLADAGDSVEVEGLLRYVTEASGAGPVLDPRVSQRPMSATRLEGLARCPFAFFLETGLGLHAVDEPEQDRDAWLDPRTRGSELHALYAQAMRRVRGVDSVCPMAFGQARVSGNGRGRSVLVYGTTADIAGVMKLEIGQGSFLPAGDPRRGSMVAVLGPKLKTELFGEENALGRFVRVADTRLRVIGVVSPKGRMLGMDFDDAVYVPVATTMRMA
jgi:hypothetical protein